MGLDEKILESFSGKGHKLSFGELFCQVYDLNKKSKLDKLWYRFIPSYEIDLYFKLENFVSCGLLKRVSCGEDEYGNSLYKYTYTGNSTQIQRDVNLLIA